MGFSGGSAAAARRAWVIGGGLVRVGAPVFLGALATGLAGRGAVAGPAALRGSAWRRRASS